MDYSRSHVVTFDEYLLRIMKQKEMKKEALEEIKQSKRKEKEEK